jgi:dynactin 1
MRDLSLQDKGELNSLRKQNDELTTKLKQLTKEIESLKTENGSFLLQINELKDQVTANLGSVELIEKLTEKNLDLEAQVIELREEIVDLEAINEVNDQIEENTREEEKQLRQSLDMAEARVRDCERQIEALKYNISDHDKTLLKFRELVKQLQNENDSVTRQLRAKIEEQNSLNTSTNSLSQSLTSTYDFKQKFIDAQNTAKHVENECNKIELHSSRRYGQLLLSFMPESFVKQSGNNECLLTLVFFKRVSNKCDLLYTSFKEKINNLLASASESNDGGSAKIASSQMAFFHEITYFATLIRLLCNKIEYILNTCEPKVYTNIGSMHFDFNLMEKNLDGVIDLMQKDQLDESTSLEGLEKVFVHFQAIYNNYMQNEKFDHATFLADLAKFDAAGCESVAIDLQRLMALLDIKEDASEVSLLFRELTYRFDEIKTAAKKGKSTPFVFPNVVE